MNQKELDLIEAARKNTGAFDKKLMQSLSMDPYKATASVATQDPLTYESLREAQKLIGIPKGKPGTFRTHYQYLHGKQIIVPENWMIVEDPASVFHDIKLYHYDRLMKTFHDIPDVKDDIDRFIKEYRYGT